MKMLLSTNKRPKNIKIVVFTLIIKMHSAFSSETTEKYLKKKRWYLKGISFNFWWSDKITLSAWMFNSQNKDTFNNKMLKNDFSSPPSIKINK